MEATTFYVGTASWQEPDFIKYWYPKGLPKTKLPTYYAEHFNFVEVNGSFYGIPQAKTVETWCKQTPDDFIFTVKLHKLLSRHSTEAKFLPVDIRERATGTNGRVERLTILFFAPIFSAPGCLGSSVGRAVDS